MKKLDLEKAMVRLEEIADLLESGEKSLDESLELFQEATELVEFCSQSLQDAETKLKILGKRGEKFTVKDSDIESNDLD